uniref:Uncharacterized protein n=1 Tax=Euplotes harpa TaxID=151035 RepID=A0A7S3JH15_9SPIT|mmetsp:Transcript_36738/g.42263  ORF Transcript_36738/g.42263 Transcript_36738/m.42263 type:complete len:167 (+) Transcript_36738:20-520(+)
MEESSTRSGLKQTLNVALQPTVKRPKSKMSTRMLQSDVSKWIHKQTVGVVSPSEDKLSKDEKIEYFIRIIKRKKTIFQNICTPQNLKMRKNDIRSVSRNRAADQLISAPISGVDSCNNSKTILSKESYVIGMKSYLGCTRNKIMFNDLESQKRRFNFSPLPVPNLK